MSASITGGSSSYNASGSLKAAFLDKVAKRERSEICVIVIDESEDTRGLFSATSDIKAEAYSEATWNTVSTNQLDLLAGAKEAGVAVFEVIFGARSRQAIRDITGEPEGFVFSKREANAYTDSEFAGRFTKSGFKYFFVMGFDANACVVSTIGAFTAAMGKSPDNEHYFGSAAYGLLQHNPQARVYTSPAVLHPSQLQPVKWGDLARYERLLVYSGY